jgi:uncharacterized protein (TIGR03435 family)
MSPIRRPKCVLAALLLPAAAFAQSSPRPTFTIADVHAVAPTASFANIGIIPRTNRFELRGATMVDLIRIAWGVGADKVAGGPAWLETDRFDVAALTPDGSTREAMNGMLQVLLAERFSLVVHNDTRELPAFAMTVAKGGPKLKKSNGADDAGCKPQSEPQHQAYVCQNMTMAVLAQLLPSLAPAYFRGTPLVDQTKLDGAWDFTLKWTPFGRVAAAGADGIFLFDYTEKQLGLHIEMAKAPLPVVVVESVNEKPTANLPGISEKLPARPKEFEAAVIKPSDPGATEQRASIQNGRVNIENLTLKNLFTLIWDLPEERIAGLPSFADRDRYNVIAKAAPGSDEDSDSLQIMAQALLTDRFKIKTHNEDRPIDVLVLMEAKPKLTKADPANRSSCRNVVSTSLILSRSVACQNTTMAQLAAWLGNNVGGYVRQRPVVDGTGLDGAWDFTFAFSNPLMAQSGGGGGQDASGASTPADPNGAVSLFDALEKQLGLKLQVQKRPMPVLVIDHIEPKPIDN